MNKSDYLKRKERRDKIKSNFRGQHIDLIVIDEAQNISDVNLKKFQNELNKNTDNNVFINGEVDLK
jgi:superfamily II DNA or RNA helicase